MSANMVANTVLAGVALMLGTVAMLAFVCGEPIGGTYALVGAAIATWGIF